MFTKKRKTQPREKSTRALLIVSTRSHYSTDCSLLCLLDAQRQDWAPPECVWEELAERVGAIDHSVSLGSYIRHKTDSVWPFQSRKKEMDPALSENLLKTAYFS